MLQFLLSQRVFLRILCLISLGVISVSLTIKHALHILPCNMCILERYPYVAVMGLYLIGFLLPHKPQVHKILPWLMIPIFLISVGLSFYHVGLEHHVFELPSFCGNASPSNFQDVASLKAYLTEQKDIIRCDLVTLRILGLSMAEWKFFLSLFLLGLSVYFIKTHSKN